jgi:hypothetical protein
VTIRPNNGQTVELVGRSACGLEDGAIPSTATPLIAPRVMPVMYKRWKSTSECPHDGTRIGKCWFWEVGTIRDSERFVTVLCQDLKMMTIMTDLNFAESISYVD